MAVNLPATIQIDEKSFSGQFTGKDGALISYRLIRPGDAELLIDLFQHLSPETRRRRFNIGLQRIEAARLRQEAERLADVDNATLGGAVLAFAGATLIGVARLAREEADSPEAEAAVVVRDDFQRQGIGTALAYLLLHLAARMNLRTLSASVQANNSPVFALLEKLDLPMERDTARGETVIKIRLDADVSPDTNF